MIFSTNLFVFIFLPVFLAVYYSVPWRAKSYVILVASYCFYGWWRVEYLLLIFCMSAFSFYAAKLSLVAPTPQLRKVAMITGVAVDLCGLAYFKYANFFVDNVNGILTFSGSQPWEWYDVLLPIGCDVDMNLMCLSGVDADFTLLPIMYQLLVQCCLYDSAGILYRLKLQLHVGKFT